jgi:hypothetical protein
LRQRSRRYKMTRRAHVVADNGSANPFSGSSPVPMLAGDSL